MVCFSISKGRTHAMPFGYRVRIWSNMTFQVIYPRDIDSYVKKENALLLDIRSGKEYAGGHWQGAKNYPYDTVDRWEKMLPGKRKIVLYCEHGGSSMQLARRLGALGYQVATVVGGYRAMEKFKNQ